MNRILSLQEKNLICSALAMVGDFSTPNPSITPDGIRLAQSLSVELEIHGVELIPQRMD